MSVSLGYTVITVNTVSRHKKDLSETIGVMTQTVIALMTEEKEKIVALRAFVPESLRNDFKSVCAKEGKNMSDVLTEFIESYVKERSPTSGTSSGKGRGKGAAKDD